MGTYYREPNRGRDYDHSLDYKVERFIKRSDKIIDYYTDTVRYH